MIVNRKSIEDLVLLCLELDEVYQKKLIINAWELLLEQYSENEIRKSNENSINEYELKNKIKETKNRKIRNIEEALDVYENKMNNEQKAKMIAAIDKISKGKLTEKVDVEIHIHQKKLEVEDVLKEIFVDTDEQI